MNLSHSDRAQVLVEALPYIQRYYGKTIVVTVSYTHLTLPTIYSV